VETCIDLFVRAFVVGMTLAAAIGPIAVLYLRRSMTEGWRAGAVTVAGAAAADAVYATIAAFGLTAITAALVAIQMPVRLVGGLYLLYIGCRIFWESPNLESQKLTSGTLRSYFISTFGLMLTNPLTIILFASIFAGTGLGLAAGSTECALALAVGVPLGSLSLSLVLATVASRFRSRLTPPVMIWINRIAGVMLCLFAVTTLASMVTGG